MHQHKSHCIGVCNNQYEMKQLKNVVSHEASITTIEYAN